MKITTAAACIATALAAGLSAAPVSAQTGKAAECEIQAALFQSVADLRLSGQPKAKALRSTRAALTDANRKYEPVVEPIVEYVYAVDAGQLGPDLSALYKDQCMAAQ